MQRRSGIRRAIARLVAVLVVGLFLSTATPAWADFNLPITGGTGGSGSTGNGGGNPGGGSTGGGGGSSTGGGGGGGGGSVGSGGNVTGTFGGKRYDWFELGQRPPAQIGGGPEYVNGSPVYRYGGKCDGATQWGPYIGVLTQWTSALTGTAADTDGQDLKPGEPHLIITSGSYTCIDPPHYRDQQVMCAHSIGADAYGPYRNPNVAAGLFYSAPPQPTPFVTGGMQNYSACTSAYTANFSATINTYGQYRILATGYQVPCTYRTYTTANARTGVTPAPYFVGCGASFPFRTNEARLQVFCPQPGYTLDWSGNHSFTAQECLETENPPWNCGPQVNQDPLFAGLPGGRTEVLSDGRNRLASWATPRPQGVQAVRDTSMRLVYLSGTPFRAGQSPTDYRQPFVATPQINQWVAGWDGAAGGGTSGWNINWRAASLPGQEWSARPEWHFTADFPVTQITVNSINVMTGQLGITTRTIYVAMDATCTGRPVNVLALANRTNN